MSQHSSPPAAAEPKAPLFPHRLCIRMPPDLHRRLQRLQRSRAINLSAWVRLAIRRALHEMPDAPPPERPC